MRLTPFASLATRREKVFKHVFDHRERWWEIFGDLATWHEESSALRGLGCYLEGWERVLGDARGEAIMDGAHEPWLRAAERACDEAMATGRVYPADEGRLSYVGELGVTVIATMSHELVTCYRPSNCLGSRRSPREVVARADEKARRRSGYFARAAVRRHHRRASLQQTHREE